MSDYANPKPSGCIMSRQKRLSDFFTGVTSDPTAEFDDNGDPVEVKTKRQKLFVSAAKEKEKKDVSELYNQRLSAEEVAERTERLDALFERMQANTDLPLAEPVGTRWVTHRGCVDAPLMIIGEAPGANEEKTGKPFVGDSGKLLDEYLLEAGIDPLRHIYVTNLVKIRPPNNRDPSFEEIQAFLPYLREQIDIVQPRMILCMGRFSSTVIYSGLKVTDSLLGDKHPKSEHQHELKVLNMGKLYRSTSNSSALYLPEKRACYRTYYSYHPAAVLYDRDGSRGLSEKWKADFEKVAAQLMKPPLKYINEIDFLEDRMDTDFTYTHRNTTYHTRSPMSAENQQRYLGQLPDELFEMQIHMVDYFSWRNEFEIEGRTRDGLSVHMTVQAPENFFYLRCKQLDSSNLVQLQSMATALLEEKAVSEGRSDQSIWVKLEMVQKRSYMGYHPNKKPYLRVTHSHNAHKYELKRMFEGLWEKVKFYEASFKPTLRFLLNKEAYYFGWLLASSGCVTSPEQRKSHCDIELVVNYANIFGVSPMPGESGAKRYEELAQYRVTSVDMEMLNPEESFPAADQNPIVSICAYSQRYNQGNLLLEQLRDPKDDTRVKQTGRSNYDDAVAFCVASVNKIDVQEFDPATLPNAPKVPTIELPVYRRGIGRKTGRYKKKYTVAIRTWNDYIARFADWVKMVGTKRSEVIYYDQKLLQTVQSLKARPDGLQADAVWEKEQCLEWEYAVKYVVEHNSERYTGDIAEMYKPERSIDEAYWMGQAGEAQAERTSVLEDEADYERFHGQIEHRWGLFNRRKTVYCYENEAEMLRGFRDYIVQYDPDMITGYNVENFDLSYYIRRVQLLDIREEATGKLISLGRVRDREDWVSNKTSKTRAHGEREFSEVHIPGRDVFDLLNIFLNETYGKLDSYILAFVSQAKLGDTKHDVPYSAIPSLYKNNRERLNDYCLKDAELVLMLMNFLNTVNFLISYAQLVGTISFGRLNVEGMQAKVFSGVIRYIQKQGLDKIFPDANIYSAGNEPCGFSDDSGYVGAHVFEPRCGLIVKLVWVLDFASLYPNIMRDNNIGHDVMGPKKMWDKLGIDCEDPTKCTKTKKEYLNPKTGVREYFYILVPRKFFLEELPETGYTQAECYESKKKLVNPATGEEEFYYTPMIDVAVLCGSLTEGLDGRSVLKKQMAKYSPWEEAYKILNSQQECLKIRNNSTYGACGVSIGKLAAKQLSEFVTLEGKRMVLQLAEDLKQKYGVEITGGDTDSVFAIFPNITELNQVFEPKVDPETGESTCLADEIEGFINSRLGEHSRIELEKCYWPSFMVAKKRGMYIEHLPFYDKIEGRMKFDGKGKLESKGLETKRRDSCTIAKDTIYGFGERMLGLSKTGNVTEAKRAAVEFAAAQVEKINSEGVPFHEMIQARKLTSSNYTNQNMPHLQVARKQEERGKPPAVLGTRIPFIIVTGRKGIKRYEAAEDPDYALEHDLQPDLKYIIDTKIYKPIERFCKWFNNPDIDEPGDGDGDQMLREIFGSNFTVHKSNLLEDDEIARFVKPLIPCIVCGTDSFEQLCGACKGDANFWTIFRERDAKRQKLEDAYEERLKVCRACMHIQPEEEVLCANVGCQEYYPRRSSEFALRNFDKTTQAIRDIEDSVHQTPMDI